jgi:hypothetical protein
MTEVIIIHLISEITVLGGCPANLSSPNIENFVGTYNLNFNKVDLTCKCNAC